MKYKMLYSLIVLLFSTSLYAQSDTREKMGLKILDKVVKQEKKRDSIYSIKHPIIHLPPREIIVFKNDFDERRIIFIDNKNLFNFKKFKHCEEQ